MARRRQWSRSSSTLGRLLLVASLGLAGCRTIATDTASSRLLQDGGSGKMCAAIRGNGTKIFAHFSSMARLLEHYGPFWGVAGGSSGSITSFLYESIALNEEVGRCGDEPCDRPQLATRMALLLKSVYGYMEALADSPEAAALSGFAELWPLLQEQGIEALVTNGKLAEAQALIEAALRLPRFLPLINGSVFDRLAAGEVLAIIEQIKSFGDFEVADQTPFFREGLVDFNAVAETLGRIADFYAGRSPIKLGPWLDLCAQTSQGKLWWELEAQDNGRCNDQLRQLVTDFRSWTAQNKVPDPRVQDEVGNGPVRVLVSTAILEGQEALRQYDDAMQRFQQGSSPDFDVDFETMVRVGYFGAKLDAQLVASNPLGFADARSQDVVALWNEAEDSSYRWQVPLSLSPAEPGLARFLPLTPDRMSMGGWVDLHPVQVLKSLGCDAVVFVSRIERGGDFAMQVAEQLRATPQQLAALFDLSSTDPPSANRAALNLADGIWCTDWNAFDPTKDLQGLWSAGHTPPLYTDAPVLTTPGPGFVAYPNIVPGRSPASCLP